MKSKFACLVLVMAVLAALPGCTYWNKTVQGTKGLYKEYVNPDPTVDLERKDYQGWELRMAELITPVDTSIDGLLKHLSLVDDFPSDAWRDDLFKNYPWISGCVASGMDGRIIYQKPEAGMKPVNVAPLLDLKDSLENRRIRCFFDDTPLGPEVYVAKPFFRDNRLAGVVAVHFDIRNLVELSPEPKAFAVFTPGMVHWGGSLESVAGQASQRTWDEVLAEEVEGVMDIDGQSYTWLARYLGDRQLLYVVQGDRTRDDKFLGLF